MLQVLVNWIYITITSYTIGFAVHDVLVKNLSKNGGGVGMTSGRQAYPDSTVSGRNLLKGQEYIIRLLLGLATVTVYAEVFSLFAGVSLMANIIMMTVTLVLLFPYGKGIGKDIYELGRVVTLGRRGTVRAAIFIVSTLIIAYGTSRGYMHIDTNLYHAQAIHWIEDYGVVPGLANLHGRFGYNSAEFALNALYSMRWIFGQSLHATAGYFVLLGTYIAIDITDIFTITKKPEPRLSDFIRLGLIFYICSIFIEMVSPASDYYAQTLIFILLILYLDNIEENGGRSDAKTASGFTVRSALISILMVYAITIKLSIGLLVLLTVLPAVLLINDRNVRGIITGLLSGLIIAVPYFIRNVIISGWMLYPSTILDIFNVDWKVPRDDAIYDANEIRLYGRGYIDMSHIEEPVNVWGAHWFSGLNNLERLLVLTTAMAIILAIIIVLVDLIKNKSKADLATDLGLIVFFIGTVFWFLQAPLIRYGYAYILIMPTLVFGLVFIRLLKVVKNETVSAILKYAFVMVVAVFLVLKSYNMAVDIMLTKDAPYYYTQQDYYDGEAFTYKVDDVTIYVATESGQIGYNKFPSSTYVIEDLHLRGEDLRSGFVRR